MTRDRIKVAAAQLLTADDDIPGNLAKVLKMMRDARATDCEIVAFHEGALSGYPASPEAAQRIDFESLADAEKKIQSLSRELNLAVVLGSTSRDADGGIYNDALILDESGRRVGRYAKTWRAGEGWYCAGRGPVIFRLAGVECTIIICHDLRFPELVRLPVIAGARLLFIVNNESGLVPENKLLGFRSMQIARATENYIYAVMANSAANAKDIDAPNQSHGNSKIVAPLGEVLDEAGYFDERLVIADLDLTRASAMTALRTVGEGIVVNEKYDPWPEIPEYARWMRDGVKMVQRLEPEER